MGKLKAKFSATVFVFCCFLAIVSTKKLDTFSRQFGSFDQTQHDIFVIEKPATINNGALQVTPDSASADFNMYNNSGRILYKQPFKLWDGDNASSLIFISATGWCHKNGKLLLVYDYMPNGSLDKHLFSEPNIEPLGWSLRYKIVSGVASALHYLHNEYEQRVVHRDLKASNIMLDSNFNSRLGDFGLARALDNGKTSYAEAEGVLGTMGYIAPECFHTGKATQQSDVFAFGAVLLELVCGIRPGTKIAGFQLLVDWVWFLHRDRRLLKAVDPRLGDEFVAEEAERLLLLGLACSHPTASERPKTQAILHIILGTVPVPNVPPFKPPFVWPAVESTDIDSSSVNTTSMTTSHFGSGWSPQDLSMENYTGYTDSLV
ncbi:probable L-type lectin-domain containing receptor kinase S.5 [Olea europaea var. sylvestris]|uniref:probable L-type lectin-domain containing receptor kinase S.5 n=1 Tax=Olea europaea var. sylvestris TaxID=158386 RepID=UPI000C1D3ECC|nr:probable L-type lectin-domain containing receptor kinase S.5 [Olea europaea var. sylvestris]